jgi:hypothetical protein
VTASAGPLGGTYWQGTAFGELGTARSTYTFTFSSGWWGWTPACMGLFFIPDISISGAGDTVDLRVNVTFGGTASNASSAEQNVAWSVRLRTPDGNQLAFATHNSPYTLNGADVEASSNLLTNIPVGTPFSLEVAAQWTPAGPPGGQTNNGTTNLSLRKLEVFALPEGYTANSESGDIVNNMLISRIFLDGFEAPTP